MKLLSQLQSALSQRSGREKTALLVAALLLGVALLWWLLLAPALHTWRSAESVRSQLDGQLQKMHALQAQAQALQAEPALAPEQAQLALEASVKQQFGAAAELSISGQRATLKLKGVSPEALAQGLAQTRSDAHAVPSEARLNRSAAASTSWDGTMVLNLPSR